MFKRKLGANSGIAGDTVLKVAWISGNTITNSSFIAVSCREYSIFRYHSSYKLPAMMATTTDSRSKEVLKCKKGVSWLTFYTTFSRSGARGSLLYVQVPYECYCFKTVRSDNNLKVHIYYVLVVNLCTQQSRWPMQDDRHFLPVRFVTRKLSIKESNTQIMTLISPLAK